MACQQPLDHIYSPTSYPQDLENIRSLGQAEADQIAEQVEFNDYEGVRYRDILTDFEARMLRVEENLLFIDQMKALKAL